MNEYLKSWNLSDSEKMMTTHTSDVYKVKQSCGQMAILKHFNKVGRVDEAAGGVLLNWYGGNGAVHLLNADEGSHLLEYASGEELADWVKKGKDEEATEIICDVVKQLHGARKQTNPKLLVPLRRWFRELFKAAETSDDETVRCAARIAQDLLETTEHTLPLHGDLHHHNIMKSERGWLAIDPKGLIGDPCYELANIYGNPLGMAELWLDPGRVKMLTDTFVQKLGYSRERIIKFGFVHNVVSTVWSGGSEAGKEVGKDVARLVYSQLGDS